MMTYRELFKGKKMTDEVSDRISEIMEAHAGGNEDMKHEIAMALHDGHMCEFSAMHKIRKMVPVAYIGTDGQRMHGVSSMHEYLSALGITPESAHRHVMLAHEKAASKAREKGFSAPPIDANAWDAYWCMAMMLADYWYTICGNLEDAAMMAYEYLSDPDR